MCLKSTSGEHRRSVPDNPFPGLARPQAYGLRAWASRDWLGFEEDLRSYRMKLATSSLILWLSLGGGLAQSDTSPDAEESYSDWGLRQVRGSFESVNNYFDSFLELLGGKNGVCQYRCRYGEYTVSLPVKAVPGGPVDASAGSQRVMNFLLSFTS